MGKPKIILFDGICNLCSSSVQFVIRHDKRNQFQFASLQSNFGQAFLTDKQLDNQNFKSLILIDGDQFYTRSDAALRIGKGLGGIYSLSGVFLWVPKFIRDFFYDFIAKNRYRWFGQKEQCWLPTKELKQKFIDI